MKSACVTAFLLILVPATALATHVIDQVSFGDPDCDWPAVAVSPDGLTMLAWVAAGDSIIGDDIVVTLKLPTFTYPGDPVPLQVGIAPGARPTLCWTREGFVLAFASGGFLLTYRSDLEGNWDLEHPDVMTPGPAFGIDVIDLWGSPPAAPGPDVFMTVGGTNWVPEVDRQVLFTSRTAAGWTDFETVASQLPEPALPQVTGIDESEGLVTRVYYLAAVTDEPNLLYATRHPDGTWDAPQVVPGQGGPAPIGGEFDATTWRVDGHGLLGCGMQPTCPCNTIWAITHEDPGGWQPPQDLTAHHDDYDWPQSPNIAVDVTRRLHAFWYQLGSSADLEPHRGRLEYRVRDGEAWIDAGDFLEEAETGGLGSRVAMAITDGGIPVLAWTRKDTIAGEPQPRAIWLARPEATTAAPAGDVVSRVPSLTAQPNPFNPQTSLGFTLPEAATVTLAVHDVAGRLVRCLLTGQPFPAGDHRIVWNGTDATGGGVASGTYLARLTTAWGVETRKLTLTR